MKLSVLIALAMAVVWCVVIGELSLRQALLGLVFGVLFISITRLGRGRVVPLTEFPRRLVYFATYLFVLIPYDIAQSNLDMARRLLRFSPDIRPGIVRVRLGPVSPETSALVAHAITMSPGQLVVDYSDDGETIYVHLIDTSAVGLRQIAFWRAYHLVLEKIFS